MVWGKPEHMLPQPNEGLHRLMGDAQLRPQIEGTMGARFRASSPLGEGGTGQLRPPNVGTTTFPGPPAVPTRCCGVGIGAAA